MLRHVQKCDHLSEGLYWCFQCQKPERIDGQIKRSHSESSKTERMTTVARKMFSALGSTRGRKVTYEPDSEVSEQGTQSFLPLIIEEPEPEPCANWIDSLPVPESQLEERGRTPHWDPATIPELPNTQLCEMEAAFVSEMSADWSFSQELPDTQVTLSAVNNESQSQLELWDITESGSAEVSRGRPFLRLNTTWPDEQMAATIVSPLSPTGEMLDFGSFACLDISPTGESCSWPAPLIWHNGVMNFIKSDHRTSLYRAAPNIEVL